MALHLNMTAHEVESAILEELSWLHRYNVLSIDRGSTYASVAPVQNPSGEEVTGFLYLEVEEGGEFVVSQ